MRPSHGEIVADRIDIFARLALPVGIVDPKENCASMPPRQQPIVERGADVADMKPAGRRRGKTGDDVIRVPFGQEPVWKALVMG